MLEPKYSQHSAGGASIRILKGTTIQSRVTEKKHGNMLLHVQFLDPAKNDVQTLIRFIFEKQVDLKKKGLRVLT
ncbi:hypothetical protein J7J00_07320 [Bacillus sp. ISL-4]|uniref:hypothetical protein n=1 Tax=Bacillus sp. ISL-4 TaxID=2819125 RepID=UPI001BECA7C3|nr:hypothetical protein [Bacillus sp. ISL-4]MBT2665300.1 hypothetical protein [Bacillus sp. ISL-4]